MLMIHYRSMCPTRSQYYLYRKAQFLQSPFQQNFPIPVREPCFPMPQCVSAQGHGAVHQLLFDVPQQVTPDFHVKQGPPGKIEIRPTLLHVFGQPPRDRRDAAVGSAR